MNFFKNEIINDVPIQHKYIAQEMTSGKNKLLKFLLCNMHLINNHIHDILSILLIKYPLCFSSTNVNIRLHIYDSENKPSLSTMGKTKVLLFS